MRYFSLPFALFITGAFFFVDSLSVNAYIIPESGQVDYVLTHESGYLDAEGNMITRQVSYNDRDPGGLLQGSPAYFETSELLDDDSDGASIARGSTFLINYSPGNVVPRVAGFSTVEQDNVDNTAVSAAKLNLAYSGRFDLDGVGWSMPIIQVMMVDGFIGSGDDAYIQFEAKVNYILYDADGNVVMPENLEDPRASDGTERLGGSELMSEVDFLSGGGRITRDMNDGSGEVERFVVSNYGYYFMNQANPLAFAEVEEGEENDVFPISLAERGFQAPRLYIPSSAVRMDVSGFFEFQAENDGSPSGITVSGETSIPEPSSLILFMLLAPLALSRRKR